MSSTPEPRWITLASLLIRQTYEGKLNWEETSEDNSYQTIIGRNAVAISRDWVGVITVTISDSSGKVVDKFDATDLDKYLNENEPFEDADFQQNLSDLIDKIQRDLAGADEILDSLISRLQAEDW